MRMTMLAAVAAIGLGFAGASTVSAAPVYGPALGTAAGTVDLTQNVWGHWGGRGWGGGWRGRGWGGGWGWRGGGGNWCYWHPRRCGF
jgi:hypothetical protein